MTKEELDRIVEEVLARILGKTAPEQEKTVSTINNPASDKKYPILKPIRTGVPVLVTEDALKKLVPNGGTILVEGKFIVTPSAKDFIMRKGITIKPVEQIPESLKSQEKHPSTKNNVALASDTTGIAHLKYLTEKLAQEGYKPINVFEARNEKPETAKLVELVCEKLRDGMATFGIIMDKDGFGSMIHANRFKGIRAVIVGNEQDAQIAREKFDANILCIPTSKFSEQRTLEIARKFITTEFGGNKENEKVIADMDKA